MVSQYELWGDIRGYFPTPDEPTTTDLTTVMVTVPNQPINLLANVVGAISALHVSAAFQQLGTMTPHEAAQFYADQEIMTMSFCAAMIDCIENDQGVQNALSSLLANSGLGIAPQGVNTVVGSDSPLYSDDNLLEGTDCTDTTIRQACMAIVEYMNLLATDWIEGMQALSSAFEIAGYIAQSVPIAGHLSTVDYGDLIDWATDEVATLYAGAYDFQLRDEAACLLYQACCNDCNLTLDKMLQAWSGQAAVNINPATVWANLVQDIISGNPLASIPYTTWLLMLMTWKIGSLFQGQSGIGALRWVANNYADASDYLVPCDPCAAPPTPYDFCEFFGSDANWTRIQGQTINDFIYSNVVSSINQAVAERDMSDLQGLEEIRVTYAWNGQGADPGNFPTSLVIQGFNGTTVEYQVERSLQSGTHTEVFDLSAVDSSTWTKVRVKSQLNNDGQGGSTSLQQACFAGTA